jgi:hypothetical protein
MDKKIDIKIQIDLNEIEKYLKQNETNKVLTYKVPSIFMTEEKNLRVEKTKAFVSLNLHGEYTTFALIDGDPYILSENGKVHKRGINQRKKLKSQGCKVFNGIVEAYVWLESQGYEAVLESTFMERMEKEEGENG